MKTSSPCFFEFDPLHRGIASSPASHVSFHSVTGSSDKPAVNHEYGIFDRNSSSFLSNRQRDLSSFKTFGDEDSPFVMQLAFSKHRSDFDNRSASSEIMSLRACQLATKDSSDCRSDNEATSSRCIGNGKSIDSFLCTDKNRVDYALHSRPGESKVGHRTPRSSSGSEMFAEPVFKHGNSSSSRKHTTQHSDKFVTCDESGMSSSLFNTQPWKWADGPRQIESTLTHEANRNTENQRVERLLGAENVQTAKQQTLRSSNISCRGNNDSDQQGLFLAALQEFPDNSHPRGVNSSRINANEGYPFQLVNNDIVAKNKQHRNSDQWLAFVNGCSNTNNTGDVQILLYC